jgi:flagellin-like protein
MRKQRRGDELKRLCEERGISPVIATILLIAVTAVAAGVVATYVAGIWVPPAAVVVTVDDSGSVQDWDNEVTDNYKNGAMLLAFEVMTDDIDDVERPGEELTVTLEHRVLGWSVALSLDGDNTGEENYGKEVFQTGTGTVNDKLGNTRTVNWKIWTPTTTGGDIRTGMALKVKLWFDSEITYNEATGENIFWDEGDRIDYTIVGRADRISDDIYSLYRFEIDP